jgi:hypothetical protein
MIRHLLTAGAWIWCHSPRQCPAHPRADCPFRRALDDGGSAAGGEFW